MCDPGDYDPLSYFKSFTPASSAIPQAVDQRAEFVAELERMGRENLSHIPRKGAIVASLQPDIDAGAQFVNIFRKSGPGEPVLVVTSMHVWKIKPGLLGSKVERVAIDDINEVSVERRPFKNCLSIDLIVKGQARSMDYQFAFVCSGGYADPAAEERLRIAAHNASVAAEEIERQRR